MENSQNFIKLKLLVEEVYGFCDIEFGTTINDFKTVSEDNNRFIQSFESEFDVDMRYNSNGGLFHKDLSSLSLQQALEITQLVIQCFLMNTKETLRM